MLDRVREAVFSTLAPWLPNARVLDLFAGSGSLGLEALSRGAGYARLVEADPSTSKLLSRNVEELDLGQVSEVLRADALEPASWDDEHGFDIVFYDPPYPFLRDPKARQRVLDALWVLVLEILAPEGVLVFHAPRGAVDLEQRDEVVVRERVYGSNAIFYLQREEAAA